MAEKKKKKKATDPFAPGERAYTLSSAYGIDGERNSALMYAAVKQRREEQENYENWRQNAGLDPVTNQQRAAATVPGIQLQGTRIVSTVTPTATGTVSAATGIGGATPSPVGKGAAASVAQPAKTGQARSAVPTKSDPVTQPGDAGNGTNMTPEDVAKARQAQLTAEQQQETQGPVESVVGGTVHWLSSLFDTEDEADVPGEAIWDGAFRALGWGYDRINQIGSYGQSILPGGVQTASWEQAGEVSWGQMAVVDSAQRTNQLQHILGDPIGGAISQPLSMLTGGFVAGGIGSGMAQGDSAPAPFVEEDFNIYDPAQRKAAFEESTAGKWATGLADTAITIVADPTIIAGKALKITKLRQLDRLIKTADDQARVVTELDNGAEIAGRNATTLDTATGVITPRRVEEMTVEEFGSLKVAPIAKFAHALTRTHIDDTGRTVKDMTIDTIYNHAVIKTAANRDALTAALYNARTYDEASLVMKHAAGINVQAALDTLRPDLLKTMLDGERQIAKQMLATRPTDVARVAAEWKKRHETMVEMVKRMDETNVTDAERTRIHDMLAETEAMWEHATAVDIPGVGVGPTATQAEIDLLHRAADAQLKHSELFMRSLESARGDLDTYGAVFESFRGATKGFSADNAFGRAVEASRQTRAAQKAASVGRQGAQGARKGIWKVDEFYGVRGANPIARVLHWMGSERPSGMIHTSGMSAEESSREVKALLDSIPMYSGEGKALADGTVVGGWQRKQELLTDYMNAMLKGGAEGQRDARVFIDQLEQSLTKDLAKYHGFSEKHFESILMKNNKELHEMEETLKGKGYWLDEKGVENYAPYLETQLQGMTFMQNWRKIDQLAERASRDSGFFRDPTGAIAFTSDNVVRFNNAVQRLWRPAVLLRGGYTQRNVAEGIFRAAAFQWSLAPLTWIPRQGAKSTGNVTRRAANKISGDTRGVVKAAEGGTPLTQMPKRFQKWHAAQTRALDHQIDTLGNVVAEGREAFLMNSAAYRAERVVQLDEKARVLAQSNAGLKKAGHVDNAEAIARNSEQLRDIYAETARLKAMVGGTMPVDQTWRSTINNLDYLEDVMQPLNVANREALDDMNAAAAAYRKQTLARRRLYSGDKDAADPETMEAIMRGESLRDPFDPDSLVVNQALSALSSDNTYRQAVGMASNAVGDALHRVQTRHYTPVNPGEAEYWPSVTRVLNQWAESDIGRAIVQGRARGLDDDQITASVVGVLFNGQRGLELRRVLNESDALHFKPEVYGTVAERRAAALKIADDAVAPLDDELTVLQSAAASRRAAYLHAVNEFKRSGRKSEHRVKMPDGTTRKFASRESLDKWLQRGHTDIAKKQAARDAEHARLAVPEVKANRINIAEVEDAEEYAAEMIGRYDRLTAGSKSLQNWLGGNRIDLPRGSTKDASGLIQRLIESDAAHDLAPVLGDEAFTLGTKKFGDAVTDIAHKTFRLIGAVPEDLMVRAPFYGQRYRQTAQAVYDSLVKQVGGAEHITMREVNSIRQVAHARALKDTRDWLYTIDRRTAFGSVMENWVPFVSATQNSVTTVGRIIWNDPAVLGVMKLIWQAPDDLNDPDNPNNPDAFAIPIGWVPEGIREAIGVDDYLRFNKTQFDLITQGITDPGAPPLMAVANSELLKRSFGGAYTSTAPEFLQGLPGGDFVWKRWMNYNFGEGFGASESWGSLDLVLPSAYKTAVDTWIRGDGSAAAYGRAFNSIRMSEVLKWRQGYREDEPTYEEIEGRTKAMQSLRAVAALALFTAPKYSSDVEQLAAAVRQNDSAFYADQARPEGEQLGIMPSEELYGDSVVWAVSPGTRSNTSGMPASTLSISIAEDNQDLIRDVAPAIAESGDLSLLGMYVPDPDMHYAFDSEEWNDPTTRAWQMANKIPGASGETYREVADLSAEYDYSKVEGGWKAYIRGKATIEAVRNQAGIYSWTSAGAEPYAAQLHALEDAIASDKMYEGWWDAKQAQQAGTRTRNAIVMIEKGLSNPKYRERFKDDPIWGYGGAAEQYIANRQAVVGEMERLGIGTTKSKKGGDYRGTLSGLAQTWAQSQSELRRAYPSWATFQDRFIGDDDDPFEVGDYSTIEQQAMAPPPAYPGAAQQQVTDPNQQQYGGGYGP